jgi:hypothetical protein
MPPKAVRVKREVQEELRRIEAVDKRIEASLSVSEETLNKMMKV